MVLSALAILLGAFSTGTIALIATAVSISISESNLCPIPYWVGAGVTFSITLFIFRKFLPAYQKQKQREQWEEENIRSGR